MSSPEETICQCRPVSRQENRHSCRHASASAVSLTGEVLGRIAYSSCDGVCLDTFSWTCLDALKALKTLWSMRISLSSFSPCPSTVVSMMAVRFHDYFVRHQDNSQWKRPKREETKKDWRSRERGRSSAQTTVQRPRHVYDWPKLFFCVSLDGQSYVSCLTVVSPILWALKRETEEICGRKRFEKESSC